MSGLFSYPLHSIAVSNLSWKGRFLLVYNDRIWKKEASFSLFKKTKVRSASTNVKLYLEKKLWNHGTERFHEFFEVILTGDFICEKFVKSQLPFYLTICTLCFDEFFSVDFFLETLSLKNTWNHNSHFSCQFAQSVLTNFYRVEIITGLTSCFFKHLIQNTYNVPVGISNSIAAFITGTPPRIDCKAFSSRSEVHEVWIALNGWANSIFSRLAILYKVWVIHRKIRKAKFHRLYYVHVTYWWRNTILFGRFVGRHFFSP